MLKEFREFIARGNVMDLAVGIIIGAAFTAIVSSLVDDLINPLIGLVTGGVDFSSHVLRFGEGENAATFRYGAFITAAEWLDVNYGSVLRSMLADGLGATAVHVIDAGARPFADALATGAITCFRVGSRPG